MSWIVNKDEWNSVYNIVKILVPGLNYRLDQYSTDILSNKLSNMKNTISLDSFLNQLSGREQAIVIGCGENINKELNYLSRLSSIRSKSLIVVADAAVKPALEHGIIPDLVVTDLDGDLKYLLLASVLGSITVIHAHGDNINRIEKYVELYQGPVIGSTQVEPRPHVYNFGGFTDGDRALYILYHVGYRDVILVGFDLENPSNCPGKMQADIEIKKRKLEVAKIIISILTNKGLRINTIGALVERPSG